MGSLLNMSGGSLLNKGLPYDAEIEYLESSGTQWIDTGIKPKAGKTAVEFMFSLNQLYTFSVGIFGSRNGVDPNSYYPYNLLSGTQEGPDRIRNDWSYGAAIAPRKQFEYRLTNIITANTQIKVQLNADSSAQINNDIFSASTLIKNDVNYTMYLGSINTTGTVFANKPSAKWYYCKLWDNGTFIRDMIPVRVGTTGYLYDKVSGQLFGNSGTGNFILGPDIN